MEEVFAPAKTNQPTTAELVVTEVSSIVLV